MLQPWNKPEIFVWGSVPTVNVPTLADLMNDVAAEIPGQWRSIGINLHLSFERLEAIGNECRDHSLDCFSAVFNEWKSRAMCPYTWETIMKVLESKLVKNQALADTIRRKYLE